MRRLFYLIFAGTCVAFTGVCAVAQAAEGSSSLAAGAAKLNLGATALQLIGTGNLKTQILGAEQVEPEIVSHCQSLGLPILPFDRKALEDGSYVDAYCSFYDEL